MDLTFWLSAMFLFMMKFSLVLSCGYSRPGPWEGRGALLRGDLRHGFLLPQTLVPMNLEVSRVSHRCERL